MKHYKDTIIQGAQLFRQLQGHQVSNNELTTAKLHFAASGVAARALSQRGAAAGDDKDSFGFAFGSGGGKDESGGDDLDFFSSVFGGIGIGSGEDGGKDEIMENLEQCGIDVDDMATKALGAFMLSGGNMDFSSPESYKTVAPILLALKDDDEVNCEGTESAQIVLASEEYLKCSGVDEFNFEDTESITLMENIEDVCQPMMDKLDGKLDEEDLNENSDFAKSSKLCIQALLGDNLLGNIIRYEYDNLDRTFSCFSNLSEALPHCVVSPPPTDDGTTVSFPLSLEKKMACVIGSSYGSMLDEACTGIYEGLDKCLPQTDVTNVDEATNTCAREGLIVGKIDFIGMDASVLTSNRMPAFCYKIFEDKKIDISELQARLDHYNENREYGWTLEIASDAAPKIEASEQPEETYISKPVDIASVESLEWEDGEAASAEFDSESASGKAQLFSVLVAGAVVVGAVALALIVKHVRSKLGGARSQSNPKTNTSRKEYAHVAVKAMEFA